MNRCDKALRRAADWDGFGGGKLQPSTLKSFHFLDSLFKISMYLLFTAEKLKPDIYLKCVNKQDDNIDIFSKNRLYI